VTAGRVDEGSLERFDKGLARRLGYTCSIPLAKLNDMDTQPASKTFVFTPGARTVQRTKTTPSLTWAPKLPFEPVPMAVVPPTHVENGASPKKRSDSTTRKRTPREVTPPLADLQPPPRPQNIPMIAVRHPDQRWSVYTESGTFGIPVSKHLQEGNAITQPGRPARCNREIKRKQILCGVQTEKPAMQALWSQRIPWFSGLPCSGRGVPHVWHERALEVGML
jgi:hypothetical protein